MFRNALTVALVFVVSLAFPQASFASYAPVKSGTWTPGVSLANARSGATATLMYDGRVLVAGGFDTSGAPLASVEIYAQDGSVSAGPSMSVARAKHAAILLNSGEVLVTGGVTSTGNDTDSSELFDPVQNVWVHGGTMLQARAQHTLSLLPDGSVLVAGGANSGTPVGVLEVYDDASGVFSAAGSLATPRTNHGAAVLQDGRVIVVGGMAVAGDGTSQMLSSSEIYDPAARTVTAGPSLITARSGFTATTTLAGVVVVIGGATPSNSGNGGSTELNSIELFDPNSSAQTFVQSGAQLSTARTGHLAMLLPHNANVLVVGGTAAGAQLASAELYSPWLDAVTSTGAMAEARGDSAGTSLMSAIGNGTDGVLLVTSGQNSTSGALSSSELYGFATVKTDRGDYAPGDPVTITGSGWQPGETVTLSFRESPNIDTPGPFTAVADQNGNISDMEFAPDLNDVGIRFFFTAVGTSSGLQAQHTFTDGGVATTTTLTCAPASGGPSGTWTCTASTVANNGSAVQGTISFTVSPTSGGTVSPSDCGNQGPSNAGITCSTTFTQSGTGFPTITATFTPHDSGHQLSGSNATFTITPSLLLDVPNPASVAFGSSGPVTFTAHLTANGGTAISGVTVTFTVDGISVGTGVTGSTGTATLTTYNPFGLAVGSHVVQASFPAGSTGGAHYGSGTSNQQTLTVIQNSTTTSINAPAITYGQNGSVTVTVTSGSGTPTGSVSLSFNGGAGVSKTLTNGSATFTNADISGLNLPAANTSGYPLSATYTPDTGSTFVTSTGTGTLVVNPLAVTLTAGSYGPAAYDGNTHALSNCASTQPSFVTCTNSPAGPVGPDVGGAAVSPTPVYAQGSVASDFTITSNNGSWSITTRAVTLTAGSLSNAVYNGSQQSLSACASSEPTYLTCTNNPAGPVGPDVGSGTVSVATPYNYLKGNASDYAITPVSGSWAITPLGVTLTAGRYGPVAYDGNTHTLSACSSSAATLITCTNGPTGPVGPDVGSGTVTPTPVYAAGSVAGDFTITSKNGSWSITPLGVTLTAGSLNNAVYNGSAQSIPACGSSAPTFVTCADDPTSVGPNVGSGTINVSAAYTYVKGNASDYAITPVSGTWSIIPMAVTLTGGGYGPAAYDGNQHTLSACSSSATLITCTNNPTGPVGPDVGSGTVTPTPVYAAGSVAGDFTITSKNGAWSITPLAVTLTSGSLNAVYSGTAQSPSACTSSAPAFVTCTNSPSLVGPNVGTGTVSPMAAFGKGTSLDYSLTSIPGAWAITPMQTTLNVTVPSVQYSDPDTFTGTVGLAGIAPAVNGTVTVTASNGLLKYSCTTAATSGVAYSCTIDPIMWAPGGTYSVTAIFSPASPNYSSGASLPVPLPVTQEDAAVTYTGQTFWSVASTVTSVNVPVSFTLQDATATGVGSAIYDAYAGDISLATVNIAISGQYFDPSKNGMSNFNYACNPGQAVTATGQTDPKNGLPSTATVQCTIPNVPVNGTYQVTITPGTNSYYQFPGGYDTVVYIGITNGGGGFITGGGYQTATYLNSNPSATGAKPAGVLGTMAAKTNFGYTAKYNKSGSNLQASVNVIVRTKCDGSFTGLVPNYQPKPGDDGLCLYQIKSNKVISMSDVPFLSTGSPGYGVLVVGANIQDVTGPTAVSLMGGGQLQLIMYDNAEPGTGKDTLTLQVTDGSGKLWFSNSWTGMKTAIFNGSATNSGTVYAPVINGGNLQVH